jgi:hypothetical protein
VSRSGGGSVVLVDEAAEAVAARDAQDTVEVAAVEDQQSVEAFSADGSDEPLGDGGLLAASARAS